MEQLAIVMAIGLVLFALFAFLASRRGRPWRRFAMSAGILGALALVSLGLAYTVAPNIPTPPVPLTARFAQNPVPDTPEAIAAGKALYQKNCAVCHGPRGQATGPPPSAPPPSFRSACPPRRRGPPRARRSRPRRDWRRPLSRPRPSGPPRQRPFPKRPPRLATAAGSRRRSRGLHAHATAVQPPTARPA